MHIQVFLGTGGVGKTSVAAASALRAALAGGKCLVVTIDPAMRLRTALGMEPGGLEQRVPLGQSAKGELWAALLDVRASLDRAILRYGKPEQAKTILEHPIYQMLASSLVGMQELMAIERIHQALEDGFSSIFIDTAPSRHALEFLDKPEYFTRLVSFPIVKLVGRTYKWWVNSPIAKIGKTSFELYARVEEILGATLVHQVLDFFSVFRKFAEGYADRAEETLSLLRDSDATSFTIVTTPSKALRDGEHFFAELTKRKFPVGSLVLNRVWPEFPPDFPPDPPPQVQEMVGWYEDVCQSHRRIRDAVSRTFSGKIPKLVALPELAGDLDGLQALHQMVNRLD